MYRVREPHRPSPLSRLEQLAAWVPEGVGAADVACDHAKLAVGLVRDRGCSPVVAIDVGDDPIANARETLRSQRLAEAIDLRQGDGFAPLAEGEVTWASVAGVGGKAIREMLDRVDPRELGIRGLVLQPNERVIELREHLVREGWQITDEVVVEERGWGYVLLRAEASNEILKPLVGLDRLVGPVLRTRADGPVRRYLGRRVRWARARVEGIRRANVKVDLARAEEELAVLQGQLRWVQESSRDHR